MAAARDRITRPGVAAAGVAAAVVAGTGVGAGADGQEHGLLQERHRVHGRIGPGGRDVVIVQQGHVEAALAERGGHVDGIQFSDHEVEGRVVAAQGDQCGWQHGAHRTGERADPHGSQHPRPRGGQRGGGGFQGGENRLGVPHQGGAGRGEADPAADVFQQRHARLPLQGGELLRHRRRRVGVRLCHRGDRAQVGQIPEQAQAADIKHQPSLSVGAET